ncbi:hypothetical protein F5Y05DRAFT_409882 [Hypoxylon sp. FL0543]|nr:hypothetical protein F5Y05DRAFT_409882 [Hypoxylon sp. FL0543]
MPKAAHNRGQGIRAGYAPPAEPRSPMIHDIKSDYSVTRIGNGVPGEEAYTSEPPEPLTKEETSWIKKLIQERKERRKTVNYSAASSDEENLDFNTSMSLHHHANSPYPTKSRNQALICATCKKSDFKSVRTYLQHIGEVHMGTRRLWPGCSKKLPSVANLSRHLVHQHNEKFNNHLTCHWPSCRKVFTVAEGVSRHLRQHRVKALNAFKRLTS